MVKEVSTKRYAQAIFTIAIDTNSIERWETDLASIEEILTNKDLLDILDSPQIPRSSKVHVIGELLGNSVSELAINLITLLALDNIAHIIKNIKLEMVGRLFNW